MIWNESEIVLSILLEGFSLEDAERIVTRLRMRAGDKLLPLDDPGSRDVGGLPAGDRGLFLSGRRDAAA